MDRCETCRGTGKVGPVHINRGEQPHEWVETMPCDVCKGSGEVTAEHARRIALGRIARSERLSRDESLREAAKRLGISPAELSRIERGEHQPKEPTHDN